MFSGLAVLAAMAWMARHELAVAVRGISLPGFLGAVLLGILLTTLQGRLFHELLGKHGGRSRTRDVVAAFLVSQPGKYVPGKVWPALMQSLTLGRAHSLLGLGIANVEIVLLGMVQMTLLGAACLLFPHPLAVLALLAGVVVTTVQTVAPTAKLLGRMPDGLKRRLRLSPGATAPDHPVPLARAAWLNLAATLANVGASSSLLLAAGELVPPDQIASILAVLYLGFAASFLVVPVPAGVGVREAATVGLGMLITPEVPATTLVAVSLLARAWQLAVDAGGFGLGVALLHGRQARPPG